MECGAWSELLAYILGFRLGCPLGGIVHHNGELAGNVLVGIYKRFVLFLCDKAKFQSEIEPRNGLAGFTSSIA